MTKLIMMKGLPASGKSTRCKEIVESGGQFIRVNRDLLRTMLHFDRFTGKNEGITVNVEKAIAINVLSNGMNVVVDDCNLNPKNEVMWREVAESVGATFMGQFVETDVEDCIKRDKSREKSVGRSVIMRMALESNLYRHPEKAFVLCDLDGTLCNLDHRLQYAKGETKDWDKFFAGVPLDTPRTEVIDMLTAYSKDGYEIIFVSARPERCRKDTAEWLNKHLPSGLNICTLFMRGDHDKRDDTEVKGDMYDKLFKDKYKIHTVIDDRPKVIRMWRERGLNVEDVGAGIEF